MGEGRAPFLAEELQRLEGADERPAAAEVEEVRLWAARMRRQGGDELPDCLGPVLLEPPLVSTAAACCRCTHSPELGEEARVVLVEVKVDRDSGVAAAVFRNDGAGQQRFSEWPEASVLDADVRQFVSLEDLAGGAVAHASHE